MVLTPAPIPPAGLVTRDLRARRADLLIRRLDVLDADAARLARQAERLLADSAPDCAALATLRRGLELALAAARDAERTVQAELPLLPALDELAELRERADRARARRAAVEDRLWPSLDRRLARRCPGDASAAPTVWLPEEERTSVDGAVTLFVRAPREHDVVWVEGAPAGRADAGGWAIVVAPARHVRLCVTRPVEDRCEQIVEVEATPLAAFDLSARR